MELNMNSDQVLAALISIGETPGKNDKVAMIKTCAKSKQFVAVLEAGLQPHITYGVAKRQPSVASGTDGRQFNDSTFSMLDALAARHLSGNAALAAIEEQCRQLTPESEELLWRIITKDLKGGFGESTVNKAIPKLILDFPYMRCSLPKEAKLENYDWAIGVLSQEKADGMFFNVDSDAAGEVTMSSRQGTQFPLDEFAVMVDEIKATFPSNTRLNGEIEVVRDGRFLPREIGNGIMNHVQDGGKFSEGDKPILKLWDMLPLDRAVPKGRYPESYLSRVTSLSDYVYECSNESGIRMIDTRIVHSLEDAYKHYAELLALGKEGTVVKCPNGIWMDTTSKHQCKLKLEFEVDLKIVGYEAGKGKNESTFGSIIAETSDGLLRVCVSGFKDKPGIGWLTRAQIWEMKDELLNTVMTVRANGIMRPSVSNKLHSLFLPRFVEFRRDKIEADTLAQVFEQEEAAKDAAGKGDAELGRFSEKLAA